jgi:hypothetical protein
MTFIELACFLGLPTVVALLILLGMPEFISLAFLIGAGSAFASLLIVLLLGFAYRLVRGRLPEQSPVRLWATLAILLSASSAVYCRIHPLKRQHPSKPAAERTEANRPVPFVFGGQWRLALIADRYSLVNSTKET